MHVVSKCIKFVGWGPKQCKNRCWLFDISGSEKVPNFHSEIWVEPWFWFSLEHLFSFEVTAVDRPTKWLIHIYTYIEINLYSAKNRVSNQRRWCVQADPSAATERPSQLLCAERSQSGDGRHDVRVSPAADAAAVSGRGGLARPPAAATQRRYSAPVTRWRW